MVSNAYHLSNSPHENYCSALVAAARQAYPTYPQILYVDDLVWETDVELDIDGAERTSKYVHLSGLLRGMEKSK